MGAVRGAKGTSSASRSTELALRAEGNEEMNIDAQNFGIFDVMADQGCALVGRETFRIVTSNKAWSQLLEDNVEGDLFTHLPSLDADPDAPGAGRVGRFQADIEVHNAKRGEMGLRVAISTVEARQPLRADHRSLAAPEVSGDHRSRRRPARESATASSTASTSS